MPKQKNRSKHIEAVLFDMGKVLIRFDFTPAFKRLSAHTGRSAADIERFFHDTGLEVLYDGGKLTSVQFYKKVRQGLGLTMSFAQFRDVWNGIFTPIPPMVRILKRLHRKKRLVLVSNTNAMHYAHVKKEYDFLALFDAHVLSFRERMRKPDESIYKKSLKHCRAEAHEVFYIDDREDLTEAAAALGFITHTYRDDPEAVSAKLKKWGVL